MITQYVVYNVQGTLVVRYINSYDSNVELVKVKLLLAPKTIQDSHSDCLCPADQT